MANNLEDLRKIFSKHWQGIATAVTSVMAVIKGYFDLSGKAPQTQLIITASVAIVIIALIRFPRIAFAITRLIVGNPGPLPELHIFRGARPYFKGDSLPSRNAELEVFWADVRMQTFVVLQGESGCGKSSFLNACLTPRMEGLFRIVESRLTNDPFGRLHAAFLQKAYSPTGEQQNGETLLKAITTAQDAFSNTPDKSDIRKPLFLVIDQAEELFVTVKDEFRTQLMDALKIAVKSNLIRVLIAIRSDFIDLLLGLCRSVDGDQEALNAGNIMDLLAFSQKKGKEVLDDMLAPLYENDLLKKPEILSLSSSLTLELLRPPRDRRLFRGDEKSILPVELQMTGMMIEVLGIENVLRRGIGYYGGKIGLLGTYIDNAKIYVWRKTGVEGDSALLILRQFVSPARTKRPQTPVQIANKLKIPEDQVKRVLDAFGEQYLVKLLPGTSLEMDTTTPELLQYELMHEHLVQVLVEAPQPILQRERDSEERLLFWNQRTAGLEAQEQQGGVIASRGKTRSIFYQPVPFSEIIRLWRYAFEEDDKRMLRQSLKGYLAKLMMVLLPFLVVTLGGIFWINSDSYMVRSILPSAMTASKEFASAEGEGAMNTLSRWTKDLVDIGKANEAFEIVKGIKNDQARSERFAVLSKQLIDNGDFALADSAFIDAISISQVKWKEGHSLALKVLLEKVSDAVKEQLVYDQIKSIRDKLLQVNAISIYIDWLYAIGRSAKAHQYCIELLPLFSDINDISEKYALVDDLTRKCISYKREDDLSAMTTFWLACNDGKSQLADALRLICNDLLAQKKYQEAIQIWKNLVSRDFSPWEPLNDVGIADILENVKDSLSLYEFYHTMMLFQSKWFVKNVAKRIPVALLLAGQKALADSSFQFLTDSHAKRMAYYYLADSLIERHRLTEARQTLAKIISIYGNNYSFDLRASRFEKGREFLLILYVFVQLNEYGRAIVFSKLEPDAFEAGTGRVGLSTLGYILEEMTGKGAGDTAYAHYRELESQSEQAEVLKEVIVAGLKNRKYTDLKGRVEELLDMVNGGLQPKVGDYSQSLSNEFLINGILSELIDQDLESEAFYLYRQYVGPKDYMLETVVTKLAEKNKMDSIKSLLFRIQDLHRRSISASLVVQSLADSGNIRNARMIMPLVTDLDDNSKALASISVWEARNGETRKALLTVDSCYSSKDKLTTYCAILEQYAAKNKTAIGRK